MSAQTITITISPSAAIRAGHATAGPTTLALTDAWVSSLTPEEREALIVAVKAGDGDGSPGRGYWLDQVWQRDIEIPEATLETLRALLVARVGRRAVMVAETAQAARTAAEAAIADPETLLYGDHSGFRGFRIEVVPADLREAYDRAIATAQALIDARQAARTAEETARRQAREAGEAEEAAKEAAKKAYRAQWVRAHGDAVMIQQLEDRLLCKRELLARIAASVLDPVGSGEDETICEDRQHACGTTTVDCVPTTVYPAVVALRARLPEGATITEYTRIVPCTRGRQYEPGPEDEDDEAPTGLGETVYAATVAVPAGPYTFTRRIALGP